MATPDPQAPARQELACQQVEADAAGYVAMERVLSDVRRERYRQVSLGWTPEHDDSRHPYALAVLARDRVNLVAVFSTPGLRRSLMVQAAALLVAAVESMDRKAARRG